MQRLFIPFIVGLFCLFVTIRKVSGNNSNFENYSKVEDVKLPLNCSTSMSVVFPTELLLQSFLHEKHSNSNFTSLWINFMIASKREGIKLAEFGLNSQNSNQEFLSLMQEMKNNATETKTKLEELLSTLNLPTMNEMQALVYGNDCSLRAVPLDSIRGPCDLLFISIHRMSMTKTMNLMVMALNGVDQRVVSIAYNELIISSKTIGTLLQLSKSLQCYQTL